MVIDWLESKGKSLIFADKRVSLSRWLGCVAVLINTLARDEMPDAGGNWKREESRSRERATSENVLFLWQRTKLGHVESLLIFLYYDRKTVFITDLFLNLTLRIHRLFFGTRDNAIFIGHFIPTRSCTI